MDASPARQALAPSCGRHGPGEEERGVGKLLPAAVRKACQQCDALAPQPAAAQIQAIGPAISVQRSLLGSHLGAVTVFILEAQIYWLGGKPPDPHPSAEAARLAAHPAVEEEINWEVMTAAQKRHSAAGNDYASAALPVARCNEAEARASVTRVEVQRWGQRLVPRPDEQCVRGIPRCQFADEFQRWSEAHPARRANPPGLGAGRGFLRQ